MTNSIALFDRKFISVSGSDSEEFLQGLITNDINLLEQNKLIFAAFLTPNGRFVSDFFIWSLGDAYLIDISPKFFAAFLQKLKMYKLRKDVTLAEVNDYQAATIFPEVAAIDGVDLVASDPRKENFATRILVVKEQYAEVASNYTGEQNYDTYRIANLLAEGDKDLEQEKSIILEYGYQQQQAVSFDKGCYLGQELITRTHRLGVVRKKLVSFISDKKLNVELPHNIEVAGKKVAVITSVADYPDGFIYLALVKGDYEIQVGDL